MRPAVRIGRRGAATALLVGGGPPPATITTRRLQFRSLLASPVATTGSSPQPQSPCLPGSAARRQQHWRAAVASGSASGSDQPLAEDSPPAAVERREERGLALGALFWLLLVSGLAQVVAPTRVVELAFAASPLPVVVGLVRLLGSSFTVAALATYCLQDAAFNSRLGSATYQRLGLGLMWWAIASLVVLWASPAKPLLRPHLALSGVLALVAVGTGVLYNDTSKHGLHPLHLAKGFLSSFAQLLAPPSNPWAAAYGAASVAAGAAATALWAGTSGTAWVPAPLAHAALLVAPLGTIGRLVAQLLGAGTLLAAVVLFVLKDAAERGRLGASTFKTLNVGVFSAALALGGFATHSPPLLAGARFAAALAGGSAVLAGATAFQYFFAKKK